MSDNSEFVHIIVTRLGVGVRRPSFYDEHLSLARLTVAASLNAQTCRNFIWAVAIDARAPKDIEERLEALVPGIQVEVWRRDPFKDANAPLDRRRIVEMADGRSIFTTRVDDDDFLHKSFVRETQDELRGTPLSTALTFRSGSNLLNGVFYEADYPWLGLGLTTHTDASLSFHAYRHSHTKMGIQAEAAGASALIRKTEVPMWIRTWRASSDSTAARGFRVKADSPLVVDPAEYGATPEGMEELEQILATSLRPEDLGVNRTDAIPRLRLKAMVLKRIKELDRGDSDEEEVEGLRQIFYIL